MPEELTTEYNMGNWREATKDWTFIPYSIGGYGELSSTICVGNVPAHGEPYERIDFERDLQTGIKTQDLYKKHGRSAFVPLKDYINRRKGRSV